MVNLLRLIENTGAYKTVKSDKAANRLSHAYLILSADKDNLGEYLKLFAKLILGGDARADRLISEGIHPDVLTFPINGDAVLKEDVAALIEESFLKPVESDRKLFIINHGESMNASSQNKLLKTLEEPPKNVHILIGATSEYPLLTTVKSRVKKLTVPPFDAETLIDALTDDCPDTERLKEAVSCGDGTVGKALALYGDENLSETVELAVDTYNNMLSSRNVLEYSDKITGKNCGIKEFLSVLELINRDNLLYLSGAEDAVFNKNLLSRIKGAQGFTLGAVIYAAGKIAEAERRLAANGNPQAVLERLLFAILEGKHKWRKL